MMRSIDITDVPSEYVRSANEKFQGNVHEVSYRVNNYIDEARRLVTNQGLSTEEAGREVIRGESIMKKCNVYLPAGYDASDTTVKYRVLYLLHGVGGDHYEWLHNKVKDRAIIVNIFDNLIANDEIEPLIIVFPNGRSAHDWRDSSFNMEGTNMLGFYYFDYELRHDLIPFIESSYNTYGDISDTSIQGMQYNRMHRGIAGLSMGGMQTLNLIVGGYRYDSTSVTGTESPVNNGLDQTVRAPGLVDLFSHIGAFSNAPTSSNGKVLGASLASGQHTLHLLYITCGDADFAYEYYSQTIDQLAAEAGNRLQHYYEIVMKGGGHDFKVWNNGAYNFSRLAFGSLGEQSETSIVRKTLE